MDPGDHDVVTDAQDPSSMSIFGGELGDLSSFSSLTVLPTSSSIGSGSNNLASDLLDLLGGGVNTGSSLDNHGSSFTSSFPDQSADLSSLSMASSFPNISNMPLFATVPSAAVNGVSSVQQYELIPGQFFPSSFFTLSKAEQLSKLREKAEQDSIMSGTDYELCLYAQTPFIYGVQIQ
jgi:hypothetical protein